MFYRTTELNVQAVCFVLVLKCRYNCANAEVTATSNT